MQGLWIAVLPFTRPAGDAEVESFAEGLAEDINAGPLGRRAEAAAAIDELHRFDQEFEKNARHYVACYHYASGLMDRILEGLAKAGLNIPPPAQESPLVESSCANDASQQQPVAMPSFTSVSPAATPKDPPAGPMRPPLPRVEREKPVC